MKIKNKLSFLTQLFYGLGVSYAIIDQIFVQWVVYFYLPPSNSGLKPLIAPAYIALALIISRFVDMIFDPLVGYASDNFHSKWGRRIPFIAFGSIPLVLCTIALFYPPNNIPIPLYLSVMSSLFFIFYTIVGAPYNALIPELSQSYEDRLNLSTWQSIFRLIYSAIAMIMPGFLIKYFGTNSVTQGIQRMVISLSIFALFGMLLLVFTIKEKNYSKAKPIKINFKESINVIFKDKSFLLYLLGLLFFFIGFNTIRTVLNYYIEDIMKLGKEYITIISAIFFGTAALSFYPVNRISRKLGYRKIMLISLVALTILSLMLFQLGKTIPSNWGIFIFAIIGVFIAGSAFIFPPAMLSEIVTNSNKENTTQLEGFYFGIQGFFLKLAFLVSAGFVPILLTLNKNINVFQNIIKGNNVVQLEGIYSTTLLATFSFIISFIFYYLYPEKIIKD